MAREIFAIMKMWSAFKRYRSVARTLARFVSRRPDYCKKKELSGPIQHTRQVCKNNSSLEYLSAEIDTTKEQREW